MCFDYELIKSIPILSHSVCPLTLPSCPTVWKIPSYPHVIFLALFFVDSESQQTRFDSILLCRISPQTLIVCRLYVGTSGWDYYKSCFVSGAEIVLIVNPFWRQVVPILRFDLLTRKERCDVEKHGNRLQFSWLMLDTGKIILGECKKNHYSSWRKIVVSIG